jgi:hypothetical protein
MKKSIIYYAISLCLYLPCTADAQVSPSRDSITVRLIPGYDSVGRTHRKIFGENYRREYGMETRLPLIHISAVGGGLKALQRGGGNQTHSLRLMDASGNEWTLRSVEKYPEVLLPTGLRNTFVKDIIKDNMSAQHPFSALVVPELADAIGAAHSIPVIGWVAPDAAFGAFEKEFSGTVCLLEMREPLGKSDNTARMLNRLSDSPDNSVNATLYLKLKCLDVLLGDWDRHEDQWRWHGEKKGKGTIYTPVPRDRDQVFYRSDGKVQRFVQSTWYLPMMQGYERNIQNINWFLWEGREINSKLFSGIDQQQWDRTVRDFCAVMNDALLEKALKKLPEPGYSLRHSELIAQLKARREMLPELMARYYRFFNKIVDVELTDKNEYISFKDQPGGGLEISAIRLKEDGSAGGQVFNRIFDPAVTREVRLFTHNGGDKIIFDSDNSPIRVRIITDGGGKSLEVQRSAQHIKYYGRSSAQTLSGGDAGKVDQHLSADSSNTRYLAKDLYSRHFLAPNVGYNNDDGLALGLAFKITNPGFRKSPYGNSQSFSFLYSFGSSATKFYYTGEWLKLFGHADFLIHATAFSPSNTQNFFGLGNDTFFDESRDNVTYYRARFNLYELSPALRWRTKRSSFSAGPTLQYYTYSEEDNAGRFITNKSLLNSSDSETISREKIFAGAILKYTFDTRDNGLLPTRGGLFDSRLTAYEGLNQYSNAFGQLNAEVSLYLKLDSGANFVVADRIGGGITAGKPAFYQSQFLGGQGNLLGYRQFRFAGEQSLYNNLELRAKIGQFVSYVLPGQFGLLALYDVGRVWKRDEPSDTWHHGVGGGIYFAPASLSVVRLVVSHSREGWYPYFGLSFRY